MRQPNPNVARIAPLLSELRAKPPGDKQKPGIRRKLRRLGHHGGLRQAPTPLRIWKIATERGNWWRNFYSGKCAYIGFNLTTEDLSQMDEAQTSKLLERINNGRGVNSVFKFVHDVKPGDIIVASGGRKKIMGIGLVTSAYIPPTSPDNPSPDPQRLQCHRVDWLLNKAVDFKEQIFNITTLARISPEKWQTIQSEYENKYPDDPDVSAAFKALGAHEMSAAVPANNSAIPILLSHTSRTRNILLYGPPGTGKTYTVSQFAHNFATLDEEPRFLLLNANPSQNWTWDRLFEKGEDIFEKKGANFKNAFDNARVGDIVFGYQSSPDREVRALAKVIRNTSTDSKVPLSKRGIIIAPVMKLIHAVGFRELQNLPEWRNNAAVKTKMRGTAFKVSLSQGLALLNVIQQKGNPDALAKVEEPRTRFVTFHQSFAYEEFIEGLKPVLESTVTTGSQAIKYEIANGIFKKICAQAEKAWHDAGSPKEGVGAPKFLLIIDEINRANIAKVLGELITLIEDDKRLGQPNELTVTLPYSQQKFGVPPNLYILGTLNTADRSIAQLDLALRRRFTFVEMMPDPNLVPEEIDDVPLRKIFIKLNYRIAQRLDRDHQIGHSYFMHLKNADDLHFAFTYRILPLLKEYFYNDTSRLHAVLGPNFFDQPAIATADDSDTGEPQYQLKALNPSELLTALKTYLV